MNATQSRRWKPYIKYLVVIAVTVVASVAFTLSVIWYPIDRAEISRSVDAMVHKGDVLPVPSEPQTAEELVGRSSTENAIDEEPTRDVAGLDAEEAKESSVEWTQDVGQWIADDLVAIAQDDVVTDTAFRGEFMRRIDAFCKERGGCTYREMDMLMDSTINALNASMLDAPGGATGNARWMGRLLLSRRLNDDALRFFNETGLTSHVRTVLVDMAGASANNCSFDGDVFARMLADYAYSQHTNNWPFELRLLIVQMTPSEAADVRYALRGYVSCLRHRLGLAKQQEPAEYDLELLISKLETIERGEQP